MPSSRSHSVMSISSRNPVDMTKVQIDSGINLMLMSSMYQYLLWLGTIRQSPLTNTLMPGGEYA